MKRLHKGFSLIELMIVIAIIGILAAIAIPSYQTYVKKAKLSHAVEALAYYKTAIAEAYEQNGFFPADLNSTLTFYNYVNIGGWTMMWQNASGGLVSSDNAPKASLEIDLPADLGGGLLVLAAKAEEGGIIFRCGYWDAGFAHDSLAYTPSACQNTDLHDW